MSDRVKNAALERKTFRIDRVREMDIVGELFRLELATPEAVNRFRAVPEQIRKMVEAGQEAAAQRLADKTKGRLDDWSTGRAGGLAAVRRTQMLAQGMASPSDLPVYRVLQVWAVHDAWQVWAAPVVIRRLAWMHGASTRDTNSALWIKYRRWFETRTATAEEESGPMAARWGETKMYRPTKAARERFQRLFG